MKSYFKNLINHLWTVACSSSVTPRVFNEVNDAIFHKVCALMVIAQTQSGVLVSAKTIESAKKNVAVKINYRNGLKFQMKLRVMELLDATVHLQ